MITSIFGTPLTGQLFFPILALLIIIFIALRIKGRFEIKSEDKEVADDNKTEKVVDVPIKKIVKKIKLKKNCCKDEKADIKTSINEIKIYYGSNGKSKLFSESLSKWAANESITSDLISISNYEAEDRLPGEKTCCNVFILPTYEEGSPAPPSIWFCKWLEESSTDFRVQKGLLKNVKFAVFGLGNSFYGDNFNTVAKNVDKWLCKLQGTRVIKLGLGDENVSESKNGSIENDFEVWAKDLINVLLNPDKYKLGCKCDGKRENGHCKNGESDSERVESSDEDEVEAGSRVIDVEDLGKAIKSSKQKPNGVIQDMVTPELRESLTKQGYKIVGSHSGVKLCRWTKSMLRGRGGCYKHTFYGIESHRCMETTPSLACANKCVFCWRHHSNPVGTEWKWNMDSPEEILQGALENHYKMINQFKGVPGVLPERLQEGFEAKHCALSLVGEPIMYPEINKFVRLLHEKKISSFLVTNAQFPEAITNMIPVTQLYVSVDASTKESLKKIDRPLFKDFWERFIDSLKALSAKGQRTVYRLTLVKAWNVEELQSYADLVSLGNPDFIEIKGVTYCGTSKASNLTMENVPWHDEVISFGEKLCSRLSNYKIAAEHEHSNCLLLANTKFLVDGQWHTWIDYDKFHKLIGEYESSNGESTFTSLDYMEKTPDWAVFGSKERGFDPAEVRWRRKAASDISGC